MHGVFSNSVLVPKVRRNVGYGRRLRALEMTKHDMLSSGKTAIQWLVAVSGWQLGSPAGQPIAEPTALLPHAQRS